MTRACGRRAGIWCATASSSAISWTGCSHRGWAWRGPTAARTPTRRTTCRSSGWPTCRCSRAPTTCSTDDLIARVEDGIYIVGDKSWSIDMQRYNFQFTGQRFFRIRDGKPGRPAARRRLSGHHHRLLGCDGSRWRAVDLAARRRIQLRQGAAGSGGGGQPRLPVGVVPRHQRAQHPHRRRGGRR